MPSREMEIPTQTKNKVLSVTRTGEVRLSKYNATVNGLDMQEFVLQTALGIKNYDNDKKFYGKVTIIVEEYIDPTQDDINDFGTIPDEEITEITL